MSALYFFPQINTEWEGIVGLPFLTADNSLIKSVQIFLCSSKLGKQTHDIANKDLYSQSYGISSSHVWMWELDHKEGWATKN